MASTIFNSFMNDLMYGNVQPGSDTVYGMLCTSSFTPDKDTMSKRSDITNEVSGTGYVAGGQAVALTVTQDNTNDREDIAFANNVWGGSTLTNVQWQVFYKHRGGLASADNLYACVDFGTPVSTVAGTLTAVTSTPLRFQN